MKYIALVLGAGLFLSACGGDGDTGSPEENAAAPAPTTTPQVQVLPVSQKKDVGDLEAGIEYNLTVDEAVAPAGVSSEKLENQMSKLNMVTVSVEGQRPAELWLNVDLKTQLEFPERPVAARGRIFRELEGGEKSTIFSFETVFDENASLRKRRVEGDFPPQHFRVEALQGLADLPESLLVYGEMDVVFMPEGTDPSTIDPATAKGNVDDEGMLLSNPVRINFNLAPAAAPIENAPTPGAPDATALESTESTQAPAEQTPPAEAEATSTEPAPATPTPEAEAEAAPATAAGP